MTPEQQAKNIALVKETAIKIANSYFIDPKQPYKAWKMAKEFLFTTTIPQYDKERILKHIEKEIGM